MDKRRLKSYAKAQREEGITADERRFTQIKENRIYRRSLSSQTGG